MNEERDIVRPFYYVDENGDKIEDDRGEIIKPIIHLDKEKSPEEKVYLILYCFYGEDEGEEVRSFEFVKGRTEARQKIIDDVMVGDVNIRKSRVLVEGAPLEDSISIYQFMKLIENYFEEETKSFNIDDFDFDTEDIDEEELNVYQYINNNASENIELDNSVPVYNNNQDLLGMDINEDEEANV